MLGTGKTTCIVYRLLASYRENQFNMNHNNENSAKRQIFITLSPNLCQEVKEHFNKLRESTVFPVGSSNNINRTNKTNDTDTNFEENDIMNDIPNSFRKLTDDNFPLIITYEKFIKMLQGTYGIDPENPTKLPDFSAGGNDDIDNDTI